MYPFQGDVTLSVTELDPNDDDFLDLAPGDFSITDENGDEQMLISFGTQVTIIIFDISVYENVSKQSTILGKVSIEML